MHIHKIHKWSCRKTSIETRSCQRQRINIFFHYHCPLYVLIFFSMCFLYFQRRAQFMYRNVRCKTVVLLFDSTFTISGSNRVIRKKHTQTHSHFSNKPQTTRMLGSSSLSLLLLLFIRIKVNWFHWFCKERKNIII